MGYHGLLVVRALARGSCMTDAARAFWDIRHAAFKKNNTVGADDGICLKKLWQPEI